MKKIIFILLIGLLCIIPNTVNAKGFLCDQANLLKLQKLASNITYTYEYTENFFENQNYGSVKFNVIFNNLDPRIYLYNEIAKVPYITNERQLILYNIEPGTKLKFTVYAGAYDCDGDNLITMYVNIPDYNKYYKDEICEKYPKHSLCKKWIKVDYSYEELKNKILKDQIIEEEQVQEIEKTKGFKEYFVEALMFLDEYKYMIFGAIILLSLVGIIAIKLSSKRDEFDLK